MRSRTLLAAGSDAACILAFAAAGRSSHGGSGAAVIDVLRIAWPFLAGCALAWLAMRAWRAPDLIWPRGVGIWLLTWGAGMVLRGATGGGLAPAFLLVAALTLGSLLIGWRVIAAAVRARRRAARSRRGASRPGAAAR